jgi:hypothetical protein
MVLSPRGTVALPVQVPVSVVVSATLLVADFDWALTGAASRAISEMATRAATR